MEVTIMKLLNRIKRYLSSDMDRSLDKCLLLVGHNACQWLKSCDKISQLSDVEFSVYSEWGEDGIIEWLIQRVPISSRRFVEIGVEDYTICNSLFLLQNRNWKGLAIDVGRPKRAF